MNRLLTALATTVVVLAACTNDVNTPDTAPPEPTPTSNDAAPECDRGHDDAFSAWVDAGFSGSIAISTGGKFDCLAAYGLADQAAETPNTTDTVFSIGSVSKAFTAAAVLNLVDAGKLALDDRAGDVVPDLDGPVADATIEQLLRHTSGLTGTPADDHEPLDRDEAIAAIGGLEQAFEPGTDFLYSNAGYTLLAVVIEQVSGMTYREYMADQILPLPGGDVAGGFWDGESAAPGPRAVGYLDAGPTEEMGDFAGPHWATSGNGDLAMTMRDLASWAHALFTGQVVSPELAERITAPGFDTGDGTSESLGWVAIDASAFGVPALATAGGGGDVGHNAVVVWLPESERVIAMASNTPDLTAEALLQAIGPALAKGESLPRPDVNEADVDPTELAALAGTYELTTGGTFEVTVDAGRLVLSARGADAVAVLFPLSYTADDVAAHERGVLALLAGETREGQEERAALESDVGSIEDVALAGTVVAYGELRTYVTVTGAKESMMLWYALDQSGGIAGAFGPAEPPSLELVPVEGAGFRPDDPTGSGPDVTVTFDDARLTVDGPDGPIDTRRAR